MIQRSKQVLSKGFLFPILYYFLFGSVENESKTRKMPRWHEEYASVKFMENKLFKKIKVPYKYISYVIT